MEEGGGRLVENGKDRRSGRANDDEEEEEGALFAQTLASARSWRPRAMSAAAASRLAPQAALGSSTTAGSPRSALICRVPSCNRTLAASEIEWASAIYYASLRDPTTLPGLPAIECTEQVG
eukprot:8335291-Pyramimonas_sp.AAC.1